MRSWAVGLQLDFYSLLAAGWIPGAVTIALLKESQLPDCVSLAAVVEGMAESAPAAEKPVEKVQVKEEEPQKPEPVKVEEIKPKPKRPAGEPKRRKIIRTGKPVTAAETVYQIIKSKKAGIDTADLMKETNFDEKKVRNIIYKLKKQEKIKTAKRGVYVAA